MALVTCRECKAEISSEAAACPKCGAPQKTKKRGFLRYGCLAVVGLFFFIVIINISRMGERPRSTPGSETPTSPSPVVEEKELWRISHYVDDFKNPTKDAYLTNVTPFKGTFSNTATENSKLLVEMLVDNDNDISIQLYEYGRSVPLKSTQNEIYIVSFQGSDGVTAKRQCRLAQDRIRLGTDSLDFHKALLASPTLKVHIANEDRPTSVYNVVIPGGKAYAAAYAKLVPLVSGSATPVPSTSGK